MDSLTPVILIVLVSSLFAALGVAANAWGADTRPGMGDDCH